MHDKGGHVQFLLRIYETSQNGNVSEQTLDHAGRKGLWARGGLHASPSSFPLRRRRENRTSGRLKLAAEAWTVCCPGSQSRDAPMTKCILPPLLSPTSCHSYSEWLAFCEIVARCVSCDRCSHDEKYSSAVAELLQP